MNLRVFRGEYAVLNSADRKGFHHEAHEGHEDKVNQQNINYFHNLRVFRGEYAVLR